MYNLDFSGVEKSGEQTHCRSPDSLGFSRGHLVLRLCCFPASKLELPFSITTNWRKCRRSCVGFFLWGLPSLLSQLTPSPSSRWDDSRPKPQAQRISVLQGDFGPMMSDLWPSGCTHLPGFTRQCREPVLGQNTGKLPPL